MCGVCGWKLYRVLLSVIRGLLRTLSSGAIGIPQSGPFVPSFHVTQLDQAQSSADYYAGLLQRAQAAAEEYGRRVEALEARLAHHTAEGEAGRRAAEAAAEADARAQVLLVGPSLGAEAGPRSGSQGVYRCFTCSCIKSFSSRATIS